MKHQALFLLLMKGIIISRILMFVAGLFLFSFFGFLIFGVFGVLLCSLILQSLHAIFKGLVIVMDLCELKDH